MEKRTTSRTIRGHNPLVDTRTGGKGTSGAESEVIIEETTPFTPDNLKAIRKVASTSERHTGHVMRYPLSKTEAFKGAARAQQKLGSDYMVFKSGSSYGYAPINWVDAAVTDTGRWANPSDGKPDNWSVVYNFKPNQWGEYKRLTSERKAQELARHMGRARGATYSYYVVRVAEGSPPYYHRGPTPLLNERNPYPTDSGGLRKHRGSSYGYAPINWVDAAVTDTGRWANPSYPVVIGTGGLRVEISPGTFNGKPGFDGKQFSNGVWTGTAWHPTYEAALQHAEDHIETWAPYQREQNPISLLDAVAFGAASAFASEVVRPVMRKYITHPQVQSAEGVTR